MCQDYHPKSVNHRTTPYTKPKHLTNPTVRKNVKGRLLRVLQHSTPDKPYTVKRLGKATGYTHRLIIEAMQEMEEDGIIISTPAVRQDELDVLFRNPEWYLPAPPDDADEGE